MTRNHPLALLGALTLASIGTACSSDPQEQAVASATQPAVAIPAATGGMQAYRDPKTGEFTSPPAAMRAHKDPATGEFVTPPPGAESAAPNVGSAAGLVVQPGAARASKPKAFRRADGSYGVDMRGYARTYTRAVRDADGNLTIEHLDGQPPVTIQR